MLVGDCLAGAGCRWQLLERGSHCHSSSFVPSLRTSLAPHPPPTSFTFISPSPTCCHLFTRNTPRPLPSSGHTHCNRTLTPPRCTTAPTPRLARRSSHCNSSLTPACPLSVHQRTHHARPGSGHLRRHPLSRPELQSSSAATIYIRLHTHHPLLRLFASFQLPSKQPQLYNKLSPNTHVTSGIDVTAEQFENSRICSSTANNNIAFVLTLRVEASSIFSTYSQVSIET